VVLIQFGAPPCVSFLAEEEDRLGRTGEQLGKLDRHISRTAEIITRQVKLTDDLKDLLRSGPS
jgi:hypothetical protein